MKNYLFAIAATSIVAGTLSSCKDTKPPILTVNGGKTSLTQSLPDSAGTGIWVNPDATAAENASEATITISGTVDPNKSGTYTLTYTASDADSNTTTQTLQVAIVNDAARFAGNYMVYDTTPGPLYYQYPQTITASTTVNGRIHFNKFADYQNNTKIYATVQNGTCTLPSQTTGAIGTNNHIRKFFGSGIANDNNIVINFTDVDLTMTNINTSGKMRFVRQ